jgi:spore maturation protein CgeB
VRRTHDLVWIGNWGDDERSEDLREFLLDPIQTLRLDAALFGVRFPQAALDDLTNAHIDYLGWLPNFRVPEIFAQYRVTVHVPRRAYLRQLPGIPTIRPFEALACGIPLICARMEDCGGLFKADEDFLVAHDGAQMQRHLKALLLDKAMAREIAAHGLRTLLAGHTCGHRVNELLAILESLRAAPAQSCAAFSL